MIAANDIVAAADDLPAFLSPRLYQALMDASPMSGFSRPFASRRID
jgi:hypothetical protein